jgi:nucleoside-diphosphate-sugar epimerase
VKILITGHKGFVGRNFVKALPDSEMTGIDIKDGNDCRDFFKTNTEQFDLVIHLAAIVGGRATIEGEPLSVATDLSIDAEFFNWVHKTKPINVVYFSSSAAYPIDLQKAHPRLQLSEYDLNLDAVRNPDLTYGWAKLTGEYLAQFITDSNVFVFRPFSGYGSDQDADYPFPSFIDRALAKADPFDIWGDGDQVRDFIHIKDVVQAVLWHVQTGYFGTFNLCSGVATSFNDLAELVCDEANYKPMFNHIVTAPTGVEYRVGDPHLSHQYYIPQISLRDGIRMALDERKTLMALGEKISEMN